MRTWTQRMGFPYVTVKRLNATTFRTTQKRFVKDEDLLYRQSSNSDKEYVWSIPLSYITNEGNTGIIWIHDDNEMEFHVPASDWVKFNVNQTGYYLVNYEEKEWEHLIELLKTNHELLSPADRSNLLFDSFLLAEAGHIKFDIFLSMSIYLKKEVHLIPWETAYASFVYLCKLLEFTDVNFLLKSYVKDLTEGIYNKLGWNTSNSHLENLLRTTIIGLACHSGNQNCLNDASELFQNWTRGQNVPSNLRNMVYNFGMSEVGREEQWNYMWSQYMTETSASHRKTFLNGLAHVKNRGLLLKYLDYAMDEKKIRRQDFFSVLSFIAGNPEGRRLVWNFIREKWPILVERFTLNDRYLGLSVLKVCYYFTNDNEFQEMQSFFAKYPDAGAGKRRRQQALERVQNNIHWLKTYRKEFKSWLEIEGTAPWYYHRIPPHVEPEHYDLMLYPNLEDNVFSGTVDIFVTVKKPTDAFILHAEAINVTTSKIFFDAENMELQIEDTFQQTENKYLVLKMAQKVPVGRYRLHFEFEAELKMSLKGLYKSSYYDPISKKTKNLAATQFESTHARKVFPCYDEPRYKTTYNVSIKHDSDHFALSNTMLEKTTIMPDGFRLSRFEKSPPMTTYLLAVVVCDFEYIETFSSKGVRLRVYTPAYLLEKAHYALDVGSRILTYFEDYFSIPFPLKKLDKITIPDFGDGGMENWGLVTYGEMSLLCDNSSELDVKSSVVHIIAHEIAHMWFGNLVTMEWWDDLWLNEGFATYMSKKGTSYAEPELNKDGSWHMRSLARAMKSDQTVNSRPIVQPVIYVSGEIFDHITYSKGSSVVRMLEMYMGEDFRKGVSNYLVKYSFGSAKTEDLWRELSAASQQGLDVSALMQTWTNQMNYPYLSVTRHKDDESLVTLKQHRFLKNPVSKIYSVDQSPFNYVWQIPITYKSTTSDKVSHLILSSEEINITLPKSSLIKFNSNFSGYYCVNYGKEDWKNFITLLHNNHTLLSVTDRMNLLFDSYSLASAGLLDYKIALDLTQYLKKEQHFMPWKYALEELFDIIRYFKSEREVKDLIKEHIRSLTKDLYKNVVWNITEKNYNKKLLDAQIINAACESGNYDCLTTAGSMFKRWMKGAKILPELRDVVYGFGLKVLGDETSFQFVWNRYLEESDPDHKETLMYCLAETLNTTLLERLMHYATNESLIRKHDYLFLLKRIAKSQRGFQLVTQVFYSNWTDILEKHGIFLTEKTASSIFSRYNTEKDLLKIQEFYSKHKKSPMAGRSRALAIEAITNNIKWRQQHHTEVKNWFHDNIYMPWNNVRLPLTVTPVTYNITLHPNITRSTFEGTEDITLNVNEDTDYIVVHENGLKIATTELYDLSKRNTAIDIDETFPYKRNEFWVIRFANTVKKGAYVLRMKFGGVFDTESKGMSRYNYTVKSTKEVRYLLATKFEATYARKVFPCFDEPSMKAKFILSIIHNSEYRAISNMPIEKKVSYKKSLVKTVFMESVIMSTYLLCCVVCDFPYLEANYKGKSIKVYAQAEKIQEARHGLNLTVKLLERLEEYFDVPYVLPKLDSVAIPNSNIVGMEHWGIITYSSDRFLTREESMTIYMRTHWIDSVIAHELVHQWFGNLVTMKWWNDIWLNEGVTSQLMYIPLKEYYPPIESVEVRKISKMMCYDSRYDSFVIVRNASTPSEIMSMFEAVSYKKGAAIMKMLQYALKDDFRIGLSNYLKKYAFKNAETKDLWAELSNATTVDINIPGMMNTWTQQRGFPYIELERDGATLKAAQHWFVRDLNDTVAASLAREPRLSPFGFVWKIPLVYKNMDTGKEYTLWLNERNATFQINAKTDDLVKFNPDFVGFYIVKYDPFDWRRLARKLYIKHEDFSPTDRYNLLHDAFHLAETNRLSYDVPFELTRYLKFETDPMPWNLFRDQYIYFSKQFDGMSDVLQLFKEYIHDLTSDLFSYIWVTKDKWYLKSHSTGSGGCSHTVFDLELKAIIIDLACQSHNKFCMETLKDELMLWRWKFNMTAETNFVLRNAVPYYGQDSLYDYMYDELVADETNEKRKKECAIGLTSFNNSKYIEKAINVILWENRISTDIAKAMFQNLAKNPVALPLLWNHTGIYWNKFTEKLGASYVINTFCQTVLPTDILGDFVMRLKKTPNIHSFIISECMGTIESYTTRRIHTEDTLRKWFLYEKHHHN